MTRGAGCPSCREGRLEEFYEAKSVPTNSCLLLESPEAARAYPRGDIRLGFCGACGFISNVAYDNTLTEYSGRYEETQGFSPTFGSFHERLARRLIDRYGLQGKDILEIGCGKGEFLALLCRLGGNRGIGFDPGFVDERLGEDDRRRVTVIRDFYSEKYRDHQGDLVCCKMTLEHVETPGEFVGMVRRSIGDRSDTVVFFQVPDVTRILRESAFEDVYYEHCSYFSPGSLERLFHRSGFELLAVDVEYGDQYLTLEARPRTNPESGRVMEHDDLETLKRYAASFLDRVESKSRQWRSRLAALRSDGRRVALWGSGSKGVTFLTTLSVVDEVEYVVDINPFRQGHYMAGTGHPIVGLETLRDRPPDVTIVMNGLYRDEIAASLRRLHLAPEILCL